MMWDKRVTHRAIYEAMGLSRASLSKKLRGEVAWLAVDVLAAAQVLGVEPGDLFAGAVPEPRTGVRRGHRAQVTDEYRAHGYRSSVVHLPARREAVAA